MRAFLPLVLVPLTAGCVMGTTGGSPVVGPVEVAQVAAGSTLAFGAAALVCDLGQVPGGAVDSRAGFTLWDSAPGTTAPRAHYVTGLRDGCAVQFTAAMAMFGSLAAHESLRYGQSDPSDSATDAAYEQIRAQICAVGRGLPCAHPEELARATIFVTGYESFGAGPEWVELLLHEGTLVASGVESF